MCTPLDIGLGLLVIVTHSICYVLRKKHLPADTGGYPRATINLAKSLEPLSIGNYAEGILDSWKAYLLCGGVVEDVANGPSD